MNEDEVEVVAKAMHDSVFGPDAWDNYDTWTTNTDAVHDDYRRHARAALKALKAAESEKPKVTQRDWDDVTAEERSVMVDTIQSTLFDDSGWSSEHYSSEFHKYLPQAQSIADRLLGDHFRLVEPWVETPPVQWEYGIFQSGKVWTLAESEYLTMEAWLEKWPIDVSCEYVVRRHGPEDEWIPA